MKKEKLMFLEDVSEATKKNPRKAWKELNRLLGRGKSIVDEFCTYFSSIVGDVLEDMHVVMNLWPITL